MDSLNDTIETPAEKVEKMFLDSTIEYFDLGQLATDFSEAKKLTCHAFKKVLMEVFGYDIKRIDFLVRKAREISNKNKAK